MLKAALMLLFKVSESEFTNSFTFAGLWKNSFEHIDMDLEAVVDPESFELVGKQMPDLIDFMGEETNLKDLITAGVFCFSYDGEIECPNPNYK